MKVTSLILLVASVSARDTNAFETCDKDATKTCVKNYCCSANTYRGDPVSSGTQTYMTKLCMPSGYGTT